MSIMQISYLSQKIFGVYKVEAGVFAVLYEYSLCGYNRRRGTSPGPVGVSVGLPVRRHTTHASGFRYKAINSWLATLATAASIPEVGKVPCAAIYVFALPASIPN